MSRTQLLPGLGKSSTRAIGHPQIARNFTVCRSSLATLTRLVIGLVIMALIVIGLTNPARAQTACPGSKCRLRRIEDCFGCDSGRCGLASFTSAFPSTTAGLAHLHHRQRSACALECAQPNLHVYKRDGGPFALSCQQGVPARSPAFIGLTRTPCSLRNAVGTSEPLIVSLKTASKIMNIGQLGEAYRLLTTPQGDG